MTSHQKKKAFKHKMVKVSNPIIKLKWGLNSKVKRGIWILQANNIPNRKFKHNLFDEKFHLISENPSYINEQVVDCWLC